MAYLVSYDVSLRMLSVVATTPTTAGAQGFSFALRTAPPHVGCVLLAPAQLKRLAEEVRALCSGADSAQDLSVITKTDLGAGQTLTAVACQGVVTLLVNTQPLIVGARDVPEFLQALEQTCEQAQQTAEAPLARVLGAGFAIERALVLTARAAPGGDALGWLDGVCQRYKGAPADFSVVGCDRMLPRPANEPVWRDYRHPHPKALLGHLMVEAFAPQGAKALPRYLPLLSGDAQAEALWASEVLQPFMTRYAFAAT